MSKADLLNRITEYYLNSGDFNGIDNRALQPYNQDELVGLIIDESVQLISQYDDINMYINRLNSFPAIEKQIENVRKNRRFAVYPSPKHLKTVEIQEEKPFSKMLAKGDCQLKVVYFSVGILENYVNDPRYKMLDNGYIGNIYVSDDCDPDDPIYSEYIQDYGIAYPTTGDKMRDRAIGVFLRDLSRLNLQAQYKWAGFLLPDQESFKVNYGFLKNMILADWVEDVWVFDALLEEIKFINQLCENMQIPKLFSHEYDRWSQELIGYRIILLPTLKNYYDFVGALEKIFVHNLNYKTFQKSGERIVPIERKNSDGSLKGSLQMLEEWLSVNYYSHYPQGAELFKERVSSVLREIRKIRQTPAHELYKNEYDKSLYKKQNQLVVSLYRAIVDIRYIFYAHPKNRGTEIPTILDEDKVVVY